MKISTEDYVLGALAAFLIAIVMMGSCNGGGAKTPELLAEKVFKAVQEKDEKAAFKMTVTVEDLQFMMEKSGIPDAAKERAAQEIKEAESRMEEDFKRFWTLLMTRMESAGIVNADMKMGTVNVKHEEREGLEGAGVMVSFQAGEVTGQLEFACFKNKTWKLVPPIGIGIED